MSTLDIAYADLDHLAGRELGVSQWFLIDQTKVNDFARVAGDEQWIHTDPSRAVSGPFAGTVAHGYLTLSMLTIMTREVLQVHDVNSVINYGVNRVRFPRPVRVGRAIRDRITMRAIEINTMSKRLVLAHSVEIDDGDRTPGCVAETVTLLIPASELDPTA